MNSYQNFLSNFHYKFFCSHPFSKVRKISRETIFKRKQNSKYDPGMNLINMEKEWNQFSFHVLLTTTFTLLSLSNLIFTAAICKVQMYLHGLRKVSYRYGISILHFNIKITFHFKDCLKFWNWFLLLAISPHWKALRKDIKTKK